MQISSCISVCMAIFKGLEFQYPGSTILRNEYRHAYTYTKRYNISMYFNIHRDNICIIVMYIHMLGYKSFCSLSSGICIYMAISECKSATICKIVNIYFQLQVYKNSNTFNYLYQLLLIIMSHHT